ncbi:unnamed protein product [Tetraodon nigroviridis]|uniref:(spotted green pufferfish) hypothetical protein n=1 Tax=Tetraodon nigroviridis TaxID=99883 RepID=Q4RZR6_TETNG|nr:unnamed protein product [Tetraodon nigroviridis]
MAQISATELCALSKRLNKNNVFLSVKCGESHVPESWRRSSAAGGRQIPQEEQGKGQQHVLVEMGDACDMIHTHTYIVSRMLLAVLGAGVWLHSLWESLQALFHPVHSPADTLGHPALPLPVLRQKLPPKVRHEEAHLHPHRGEAPRVSHMWTSVQPELQPHHTQPQAQRRAASPLSSLPARLPARRRAAAAPGAPLPLQPTLTPRTATVTFPAGGRVKVRLKLCHHLRPPLLLELTTAEKSFQVRSNVTLVSTKTNFTFVTEPK